jgi:hypothetical protein
MYPQDFPVPQDRGGPGAGQPIGGFGGNPAGDRPAHRAAVAQVGKAPVLLVHGNGGAADVVPWDLLDQNRMLLAAGYTQELIWAPSYLGPGTVDLLSPHTDNVDDVRDFLEAMCDYLAVEVVDVIAHSLGCTLMYSVFRGLDHRASPVSWGQPKKWNRVGTFVALAGAFHGLGAGSIGEWKTGGEFMNELLTETVGGGGETPFGAGDAQTPPPVPHTITYFCGTAAGDFVDAQNPGTGRLDGAVNKSYNLGSGTDGHQAIKESQVVFNDFRPLLNSVPPAPAVTLGLAPGTGEYPAPLTVTLAVDPAEVQVQLAASRLTKQYQAGYIVVDVAESRTETAANGQSFSLETPGMWQLAATAPGSVDELTRTYWVGVQEVGATIVTDNTDPFDGSLLVTATTSDPTASLYYSLDVAGDGATWNEGATVTISRDSLVSFIAINPQGVASPVVSKAFTKLIPYDDAVTATVIDHFIAGRIDVTEYLGYSDRFGFFTPFTLYLIGGDWVLDPNQPAAAPPVVTRIAAEGGPQIQLRAADRLGEAGPGRSVTIEVSGTGAPITVHYTRDGSIPTARSASFTGGATFEIPSGNQVIACYARDAEGNEAYQVFAFPAAS